MHIEKHTLFRMVRKAVEVSIIRVEGAMMPFEMSSKVRCGGPKTFCDELHIGDVGYMIEDCGQGNCEVEFSLSNGDTKAQLGVPEVFLEHVEPS